jgi:hypothetical protein
MNAIDKIMVELKKSGIKNPEVWKSNGIDGYGYYMKEFGEPQAVYIGRSLKDFFENYNQ